MVASDQQNQAHDSDQATHLHAQEALYLYAYQLSMGLQLDAAITEHVAQCQQCRADLAEMRTAAQRASQRSGLAQLRHHQPDLSQLRFPGTQPRAQQTHYTDQLRRIWFDLSQAVLQAWQPSALLGQARGALLYSYKQTEVADLLDVDIRIYAEEDPNYLSMYVELDTPEESDLELEGLLVTIYDQVALQQASTDMLGTVKFRNVPRSALESFRMSITLGQSA